LAGLVFQFVVEMDEVAPPHLAVETISTSEGAEHLSESAEPLLLASTNSQSNDLNEDTEVNVNTYVLHGGGGDNRSMERLEGGSGNSDSSQLIKKQCLVLNCPGKPNAQGLCKEHTGSSASATPAAASSSSSASGTSHKVPHRGKVCEVEGCDKVSRGSSKRCISHGGGKRCRFEGCETAARTLGFCKLHGGGEIV
jgi:hypothetical protein